MHNNNETKTHHKHRFSAGTEIIFGHLETIRKLYLKNLQPPLGWYKKIDNYFAVKYFFTRNHDNVHLNLCNKYWERWKRFCTRSRFYWPPPTVCMSMFFSYGYYGDYWERSHPHRGIDDDPVKEKMFRRRSQAPEPGRTGSILSFESSGEEYDYTRTELFHLGFKGVFKRRRTRVVDVKTIDRWTRELRSVAPSETTTVSDTSGTTMKPGEMSGRGIEIGESAAEVESRRKAAEEEAERTRKEKQRMYSERRKSQIGDLIDISDERRAQMSRDELKEWHRRRKSVYPWELSDKEKRKLSDDAREDYNIRRKSVYAWEKTEEEQKGMSPQDLKQYERMRKQTREDEKAYRKFSFDDWEAYLRKQQDKSRKGMKWNVTQEEEERWAAERRRMSDATFFEFVKNKRLDSEVDRLIGQAQAGTSSQQGGQARTSKSFILGRRKTGVLFSDLSKRASQPDSSKRASLPDSSKRASQPDSSQRMSKSADREPIWKRSARLEDLPKHKRTKTEINIEEYDKYKPVWEVGSLVPSTLPLRKYALQRGKLEFDKNLSQKARSGRKSATETPSESDTEKSNKR